MYQNLARNSTMRCKIISGNVWGLKISFCIFIIFYLVFYKGEVCLRGAWYI